MRPWPRDPGNGPSQRSEATVPTPSSRSARTAVRAGHAGVTGTGTGVASWYAERRSPRPYNWKGETDASSRDSVDHSRVAGAWISRLHLRDAGKGGGRRAGAGHGRAREDGVDPAGRGRGGGHRRRRDARAGREAHLNGRRAPSQPAKAAAARGPLRFHGPRRLSFSPAEAALTRPPTDAGRPRAPRILGQTHDGRGKPSGDMPGR